MCLPQLVREVREIIDHIVNPDDFAKRHVSLWSQIRQSGVLTNSDINWQQLLYRELRTVKQLDIEIARLPRIEKAVEHDGLPIEKALFAFHMRSPDIVIKKPSTLTNAYHMHIWGPTSIEAIENLGVNRRAFFVANADKYGRYYQYYICKLCNAVGQKYLGSYS